MRKHPFILLTLLRFGALALGGGCSRSEPPPEHIGDEQVFDPSEELSDAVAAPPPLIPAFATYPDPEIMLPLPSVQRVTTSIAPHLAFLLKVSEQTAAMEGLGGLGYAIFAAELELDIHKVEMICGELSAILDRISEGNDPSSLSSEIVSLEQELVGFPSRNAVELVRELLSVDRELLDPVWRRNIADRYGLEEAGIERLVDTPADLDGQKLAELLAVLVSQRSAAALLRVGIPLEVVRRLVDRDLPGATEIARATLLDAIRRGAEARGISVAFVRAVESADWGAAGSVLYDAEESVRRRWQSEGLLDTDPTDKLEATAKTFALRLAFGKDSELARIGAQQQDSLLGGGWVVEVFGQTESEVAGATVEELALIRSERHASVPTERLRAITFRVVAPDGWAGLAALLKVDADGLRRFATSVPWWDRGENLPVCFVLDRGNNESTMRDMLKLRLQVERERILREIEAWRGTGHSLAPAPEEE